MLHIVDNYTAIWMPEKQWPTGDAEKDGVDVSKMSVNCVQAHPSVNRSVSVANTVHQETHAIECTDGHNNKYVRDTFVKY